MFKRQEMFPFKLGINSRYDKKPKQYNYNPDIPRQTTFHLYLFSWISENQLKLIRTLGPRFKQINNVNILK